MRRRRAAASEEDHQRERQRRSAWGKRNRARRRIYDREQRAANPKAALARERAFRERHPDYYREQRSKARAKAAARDAVNNALKNGRLRRQPCEVCGARKAQAHHDDYAKPLKVRWLCRLHHEEAHRHS